MFNLNDTLRAKFGNNFQLCKFTHIIQKYNSVSFLDFEKIINALFVGYLIKILRNFLKNCFKS